MKTIQIVRDDLYHFCRNGFVGNFQLMPVTVEEHLRTIRHLIEYMQNNNLNIYLIEVGRSFIVQYSHEHNLSHVPELRICRAVHLLDLLIKDEAYTLKSHFIEYLFPGEVGEYSKAYISRLKNEHRLCESSVSCYSSILNQFSIYMEMHNVTTQTLSYDSLIEFFLSARNYRPQVMMLLKRFLQYLYEEGKTQINMSYALVNAKILRKEKLPSYYDKVEIKKIESAIDRNYPTGKRDYAIVLLASRLGLRASDIVSLTFKDIDWDHNTITIIQQKTQKCIHLPLLSEVGDAIIDYSMNSRPKTTLKTIFLTADHPFRKLSAARISTRINEYINKAHININGRHKGAHSLRHSLAVSLLQNGTSLPIIKDCLGHGSSESTMCYLNVDVPSLMNCSLDVPPVDIHFYTQKGGIFYEW